jgi:Skp family chaperone for outer membrane proteins
MLHSIRFQNHDQYRFCFLALKHAEQKLAAQRPEVEVKQAESVTGSGDFFRSANDSKKDDEEEQTEKDVRTEAFGESQQELRKRAREERKEKTLEQIKRIKEYSKELDRTEMRSMIIKYSGVILAASFLIGAGVFISRVS